MTRRKVAIQKILTLGDVSLAGVHLSAEQRQALALLASIPHGVSEDLLVLAHGFDGDMIAGLVRTGLATIEISLVPEPLLLPSQSSQPPSAGL